ncbi:MAG TPA: ribosome maturation factor RimP [Rhodothermales bacterium]|nr:ribosome maturation factor RimP [Rhodothermales bacterium]
MGRRKGPSPARRAPQRPFRRTGVFRLPLSHRDPALSTPVPLDPVETRVRALAEEILADTDLFLVDLSVRGWKGSRVVEVFADREAEPGEGADLDALAQVSRQLGFALDAEDVIEGKYRLDVSSPGLARPLTDARQFRRHVGRDIRLALFDGETVEGTLTDATPEAVTVTPEAGDPQTVPHDEIQTAKILLPW